MRYDSAFIRCTCGKLHVGNMFATKCSCGTRLDTLAIAAATVKFGKATS